MTQTGKPKNAEDNQFKIDSLFSFIEKSLRESEKREPDHLDRWLLSIAHRRIEAVTASLEIMRTRRALSVALLELWNDIRWYLRRSGMPRRETLELVFALVDTSAVALHAVRLRGAEQDAWAGRDC